MGIRPLKSHPITGLASILQDTDALEGVIAPNMNAHEYDDLAAPVLAAGYVVNASNPAALALSDSETGVNYDAVRLEVDAQISGRQAAAHTGIENDEEEDDVRPGRLGPPHVVMVHMKGRCDIRQDLDCLSTGNFATVRSNVVAYSGKWMYEVQLESSGILQLGWTQLTEKYTPEEGVGDSPHSYAYDGKRQRRWNVTASPYGERWTAGDIITCGVDLDQGTITYWRNGRNLGVAFRNVKKGVKGAAYAAGVSLSYGERCTVNFGSVPFVHPQLGYAPLQAPPSLGKIAGAEYVAACWERLADCLVCHPFACWSCDANKTPAPTALLKLPAKHLSPPLTWLDPALLNCTSSTQVPALPTVDGGVVETGEHAENHLNNQHMPMSEALLLAAVLGEATGKLSSHPYLVESVFLPKVLYAASLEDPHEVGVFDAFLTLLCFALEPPELESLVINVCNALGRKVRSCAWERSKFPDSVALDALTLWNRCLRCEPWARAWIRHPRWHESLEGLLFVRQPTAADLASVVPSLAWQPGDESNANAAVLSGRTGAGEFQRDVKALEEALSHLGEAHAALFTALTSNFLSRDNFADTSSKGSELGVTIADAAPALVSFVNYLIAKNKGAERNVPPPNLSHNSVVVSTFLALLRLLGPWCEGLHAGTFAFDFSTAPILGQGTCAKEEDLSRVGGTLAHLIKEHPNLCHRSTEEPGKVDSCLSDRMTSIRVGSCMNNEHACCDYQFAWWFWDRALILYSLGVDTRVRLGFTQLQTLEHGLASMQDMMTQSDAEQSAGARELLRLSIAECKKTVEDSLRQYGWHEAWLLPWKTQTLGLKLGAVTAKFIRAVATREGPLLAFVPECYVESMMDLLHSARRTFLDRTTVATPIKKPEDFARMGMDDIVSCAVEIMDDKRIVNPETKSVLLQGMHILLSDHESYYLVATNDTARDRFMMTLMNLVSDPRVWVQAANTFGMLLKKDEDAFGFPTARGPGYQVPYNYRQMREDLGLGRTCEEDEEEEEALNTTQRSEHNGQHADDSVSVHHTPPAAITDSGNEHENEGPPKLDSRKSFCSLSHCWLAPALLSSKSASLTFVNAVFDHTNWCVTEGLSLLESSGGTMSGMSGGMRRRQVSATLELCLSLLRILVSICANASTLIFYGEVDRDYRLPETSTVGGRKTKGWNMTRFAELVAYGLKHFAPDGNAYLALDAISSPSSSASNSNDLANSFFPTHLRADIAREILWMYLNCIVGLVFNPPTALLLKFSELDPDGPAGIVADALKQQDLDAGFVFMALNVTKSFYEDKAVGEDKREVIAFVGDYLAARNTDKMSQKMDVKEQGINEQGTSTSSLNESPQEKAPPEEFLDPIMSTVMEDPVTLPHSGVTVDRATIERHLLSSSTDPFSRAPLTLEDLIPNESLRAKIWEWHNGPSL